MGFNDINKPAAAEASFDPHAETPRSATGTTAPFFSLTIAKGPLTILTVVP